MALHMTGSVVVNPPPAIHLTGSITVASAAPPAPGPGALHLSGSIDVRSGSVLTLSGQIVVDAGAPVAYRRRGGTWLEVDRYRRIAGVWTPY